MFKWLKLILGGKKAMIHELNELEAPLAGLIRQAQGKAGAVNPDEVSKMIVDHFQLFLCKKLGVDPEDAGI